MFTERTRFCVRYAVILGLAAGGGCYLVLAIPAIPILPFWVKILISGVASLLTGAFGWGLGNDEANYLEAYKRETEEIMKALNERRRR